MDSTSPVLVRGKQLKIVGFLKQFEHKATDQRQFEIGTNHSTQMKRILVNESEGDDGEPSEKKDKIDSDDEGCESPASAAEKSAKDCTFEINLLFLQSVNPLLDKIEVQDVLVQCGLNSSKAGRILKSMSEDRKVQLEQHDKNGTSAPSAADQSKRPQQSGPSGIPKALYRENEKMFAKLCKLYPQRDRMFVQQCLVDSKWNEVEASTLIEAGPPTGINTTSNEQLFANLCEKFPLRDASFIQQCLVQAKWNASAANTMIRAGPKTIKDIDLTDNQKEMVRKQEQAILKKKDEQKAPAKKAPVQMKPLTTEEINKAISASFQNMKSPESEEDDDEDNLCQFGGDMKKRTMSLVNSASLEELALLPGFSKRKAEFVVKARPFSIWGEIRAKLDRPVANSLISGAEEMFRVKDEIAELMQRCTKLSKKMAGKVRQIISSNASDLAEQPTILGSEDLKLAPYQLVGLNWLILLHKHGINGILADEMGLGKTIQVISFLAYLKEQKLSKGASAIVVPASTFENWSNELERWCPQLQVINYSGSQDERKDFRLWWNNSKYKDEVDKVDIILTTYNQINSNKLDRAFYRTVALQYIIYDEAHMLKNMTTQRYQSLMQTKADYRILLTGTPLQNNLIELMSLLIFVMPNMLGEMQEELTTMFKMANRPDGCNNSQLQQNIEQAKKIMEPFVLRRLKKDVLKDLPSKTNHTLNVVLSPAQNIIYKDLVSKFFSSAAQEEPAAEMSELGDDAEEVESTPTNGQGGGLSGSMGLMMLMRRAANHPTLLRSHYTDHKIKLMAKKLLKDKTYKENREESIRLDLMEMSDHQIHQLCRIHSCIAECALPDELLLDSGKFLELDQWLPKLQRDGHRVLLFSQFTQMMDILEDYLTIKGYRYFRLDGQTPVSERQTMVDSFNADEHIFLFMLSTRAGGLGINLTAADTVIIHDIDLNPYNDKQAEDRCHRVGQTRPVTIYKMVAKNTIEDAMHVVALNKLTLEQEISGASASGKQNEKKLYHILREALMASNDN